MKLSKSEGRLIVVFACLLFLVLNFFYMNHLTRERSAIQRQMDAVQAAEREAAGWIAQEALWAEREAWLRQSQPVFEPDGASASRLLEDVQALSQQHELVILGQQLIKPEKKGAFHEVGIKMKVKGNLENVIRWLAALQAPDRFIRMRHLVLRSDKLPPSTICELEFAQLSAAGKKQ